MSALDLRSCLRPIATAVAVVASAASVALVGRGQGGDLPDGPVVAVVRERCVVCHEADLILQQRLTRAGWTRSVDKMIDWGAQLSDAAEKEQIVAYLAAHFAPGGARSSGATSAAAAPPTPVDDQALADLLESACLVCHERDLIDQQRLTRAGWAREIDKMIGWGASLSKSDEGRLADYLADRFGPARSAP